MQYLKNSKALLCHVIVVVTTNITLLRAVLIATRSYLLYLRKSILKIMRQEWKKDGNGKAIGRVFMQL